MSTAPLIVIFVRHSVACKKKHPDYGEFEKRCACRKHFRWTQSGKQYRRKANTRAWAEAEKAKRELEDHLAGRAPSAESENSARDLGACVSIFIQDKQVQGIAPNTLGKYTRELARLQAYCERQGVYTVQGITRELLTGLCATWEKLYPSSHTRAQARERVRSFLRYAYEAQWIQRIPALPKIKIDETPTLPLSPEELKRLLAAIPEACPDTAKRSDHKSCTVQNRAARLRALIRLMRYSGLAIRDAVGLPRRGVVHDTAKGLYRVVTSRQKTGTDVSVPIPDDVATEVLNAPADCAPEYLFLLGGADVVESARRWTTDFKRAFEAAGLLNDGFMISHRLRDTFAVDLLEKGVPLEEVSKLLGHESIRTTEKSYAKWVKGRQDRLDSLVTATWATPKKRRSK